MLMSTCQNALQLHNTSIQLRAEVVHLCSASRHVARVANLPAEISNFSLCRTWLLVWCLECAEVNTSPQCLKIYIGYQLSASSLQDGLDGLEVCSWCCSSLSQRPLHTRYCHLRSSASALCSDWHSTGSTRPIATGQRSFTVNGPATWNRLPPALQSPDLSQSSFKRALKTHLFSTVRRH